MTRFEAQAALRAAYPDRCTFLTLALRFYDHTPKDGWCEEYSVSILPGTDGTVCSCYSGKTLEEVMMRALPAQPWIAADDFMQSAPSAVVVTGPDYVPTLEKPISLGPSEANIPF